MVEREEAAVAEDIRELTRLLRTGDDWLWRRLRQWVIGEGLALEDVALAFSVEQGDDSEFGIIVTRHDEVYEYSIIRDDDAHWRHLADWVGSPYQGDVKVAFDLLRDETPQGTSASESKG